MDASEELHLFIIWNKALHKAAEIIGEMQSRFVVRQVYVVHWSEKHFSDNMSRLYRDKLPRDSNKEAHCGRGPCLAVVVTDKHPKYEFRQTCHGRQFVNANCFDAKERYRELAGGGHRIHATHTPSELEHDLMLLLHATPTEFLMSNKDVWNGQVVEIQRDLLGTTGWKDPAELFRALNSATKYAAIRDFESLALNDSGDPLGLELLCTNLSEITAIAKATACCAEPYRALHRVTIAGRDVPFHFRSVDSNYFDSAWSRDMLERRVLAENGFYQLCPEDHFYSLLYHVMVHRPSAAPAYRRQLLNLPSKPAEMADESCLNHRHARLILDRFFSAHGYGFVEPDDLSVDFDSTFAEVRKRSVQRIAMSSESFGRSLERLFEETEDCSIDSSDFQRPEFRSAKAIRYFSPNRALFLEGLNLPMTSSILEIGAESGILTRWLGERFPVVTALESDIEFCRAIKRRCKDLKSVRVFNTDANDFELVRTFDVAVAVIDAESQTNSVVSVLRRSKQALKKTGLLVLGLDLHPDVPSMRDGLLHVLRSYGFTTVRFFYPFPNAVLPRAIFSESAIHSSKKAYGYWAAFALNEAGIGDINELRTAGLSSQGKLDEVASGCYVVATRDPTAMPAVAWQAIAVSSEFRPVRFRTFTQVASHGPAMTVRKTGTSRRSGVFQFEPAEELPLFDGHSAEAALIYAMQNGGLKNFLGLYKAYTRHLIDQFEFRGGNAYTTLLADRDVLLRGDALDALPRNGIVQDNTYAFFDLEWRLSIPVPLSYVIYRGLSSFFQKVSTSAAWKTFRLAEYGLTGPPSVRDLCKFIINSLGAIGPFKTEAIRIINAFDSRLAEFMSKGEVAPADATLFERYHLAIALHAQQQLDAFEGVIDQMRLIYPDAPEPLELVEEPIA